MKRPRPTALTAWSLLPCAAVCALWVRSYWVPDGVDAVAVPWLGTWDLRSEGGWLTGAEPRERLHRAVYLLRHSRWAAQVALLDAGIARLEATGDRLKAEADRLAAEARRDAASRPTSTAPTRPAGGTVVRSAAGTAKLRWLQAVEQAHELQAERDWQAGHAPAAIPLVVPYARHAVRHVWVAAAVAGATPVVWLAGGLISRSRRRRWRVAGRCRGCGYDLAGNTSGICPECGTAVTTKGAA